MANEPQTANRPRVKYAGIAIALGAGIGTAIGVATGHIAVWLSTGIAVGVGIGARLSIGRGTSGDRLDN